MNLLLVLHGALHLLLPVEWFSVYHSFAVKTLKSLALVALFLTFFKIRLLRTFEKVVSFSAYRRLLRRFIYRQRRRLRS
jgi:hypothetical protein